MTQEQLINKLNSYVYTNGIGLITGVKLNEALTDMVEYAFHTENFAEDVKSVVLSNSMSGSSTSQAPSINAVKNYLFASFLVNNLESSATDQALTANQGLVLKNLIDALQELVDTKANAEETQESIAMLQSDVEAALNDLLDSVPTEGDTFNKLHNRIQAVETLLQSDNLDLDSLQEIVDALENVQSELSAILVNDLTTGGVSKALSAQQGVVLKSLIDTLQEILDTKANEEETQESISALQLVLEELVESTKAELLDGVATDGDNLNKLYTRIQAIETLLQSDNLDLDTLQEVVDSLETIQSELSAILVNDLTTGGTAKALTAQQGIVLKGLIDGVSETVANLTTADIPDSTDRRYVNDLNYEALNEAPGTTIIGRLTPGVGITRPLSAAEATDLLNGFDDTHKGLVPESGGGTSNYLRADGTWVKPETELQLRWSASDFLMNAAAEPPFTGTAIGGGSAGVATVVPNHNGVRAIFSAATANSGYGYQTGWDLIGSTGEFFVAIFKTALDFSATMVRLGLHSSTSTSDASHGAGYLEIDAGVCSFKTALSGVRTTVASVTLTVGTYYKLIIERTASSTMSFALYDDSGTLLDSTVISTNVPTTNSHVYRAGFNAYKTSTGATQIFGIDYMGIGYKRPNALNA